MFTGIGLIAFGCIFGAASLGLFLGHCLGAERRSDPTRKAVQKLMTVIGILSALVMGLLIADSKANFDLRNREVEQFAANLTLLDRELMHFGSDATQARDLLRGYTARKIELTWPKDREAKPAMHDAQSVQMIDGVQQWLRAMTPRTEVQREGRSNALKLVAELQQTSRLLAVQQDSPTPKPFVVVVIFWVSMLFLSYAIFAPLNATVVAAMLISSFSVAVAVNLILDMEQPFAGFIRASDAPMRQALDEMK
jgi:hypothetical protein